MTANVDCSRLYEFCKSNSISFSLAMLFFSQKAANSIREFRIRIIDGQVVEFEQVESVQTVLLDDESFAFAYFQNKETLTEFVSEGQKARDHFKQLGSFDVESARLDLIYYSVIPWISFTSFKHATRFDNDFTVPKIVFGRYFEDRDTLKIPVSVEANHRIMDGLHFGKYYSELQKLIDNPEANL